MIRPGSTCSIIVHMKMWTFRGSCQMFILYLVFFLLLSSYYIVYRSETGHTLQQQGEVHQPRPQVEEEQYHGQWHFVSEKNDCDNGKSKVDKTLLYFNRVPKAGSLNMVHILESLGKLNHFTHKRWPLYRPRKLTTLEEQVTF